MCTHTETHLFIAAPLSWVSPYSQPFTHSLLSHTGYKYRLLLVQCYILLLNPRPSSVSHATTHTHTHTTEGESCSDVLLAISLDDIIKRLLPQQRLPVFPWRPAAMSRWCILPHWRGRRPMTTNGVQLNSQPPENRRRRRRRRRRKMSNSLTPAGYIWVVQDKSWKKWRAGAFSQYMTAISDKWSSEV